MFSVCYHPEILLPWQRDATIVKYQQQYGRLLNTQKKGLKVCLWWKVHLAYPASLQALHLNT